MGNVLRCDAVFEGGGVRGIGMVGAVTEILEAGYEFQNIAGTSAGAIVASLVASGYSPAELRKTLENLDYRRFKDKVSPDWLGLLGEIGSVLLSYSIYRGDYFEDWLYSMLARKGKRTFADLRTGHDDPKYRYKFQAVASDLTDRRMLVLPNDLERFGYNPDEFSIARAVRMSMSIPLFFTPVTVTDAKGVTHHVVDGGLLSNYPIWLLDDNSPDPPWPTFGFKLVDLPQRAMPGTDVSSPPITNVVQYISAIVSTLVDGHDNYYISVSRGDYARTLPIPTTVEIGGVRKRIHTTDFDISKVESRALYENGRRTAREFLAAWDFADWKRRYRENA